MTCLLHNVWNLGEGRLFFQLTSCHETSIKKMSQGFLDKKRCCHHVCAGQLWEVNERCDTEPSCQAADVLSRMLSRCGFSSSAICSKALLSPSDTAHPTKTSCSHRRCCLGSRQDMIQDVLSHCCQHISNWWHSSKHAVVFQACHSFLNPTHAKSRRQTANFDFMKKACVRYRLIVWHATISFFFNCSHDKQSNPNVLN